MVVGVNVWPCMDGCINLCPLGWPIQNYMNHTILFEVFPSVIPGG